MNKNIRVAFSGSGFLAPIHVGAFAAFTDAGFNVVEVAGTSGGSIAAAMIAAGKTSSQMFELMLKPLPSGIVGFNPLTLLGSGYGYCNGNVLLNWLMDQIGENVTFSNCKIPVTIMSTDIVHAKAFEFSKATHPNTQLAFACRASSAVPFVWTPVHMDGGVVLVDGGVINNIPVNKLTADTTTTRFGIQVDDKANDLTKFDLFSYSKQLINILLSANEDTHIDLAVATGAHIIPVATDGLGFLNPRLTDAQKTALYQNGYHAVSSFLKTNSYKPTVRRRSAP